MINSYRDKNDILRNMDLILKEIERLQGFEPSRNLISAVV